MNKNATRGLLILLTILIAAVVLWRLYHAGTPTPGPGNLDIAKPGAAPPASPAPQPPAQELPGAAPAQPKSTPGLAPLQEPSPPAAKITIPPPPPLGQAYGILVDNYRKYPDAARLLARLQKEGHPAFVQRDPRNSSRFQVWLGPFASRHEAQAAQKALKVQHKKFLKIEPIENPIPK
jgi:cell division septation protein DedD